MFSKNEFSEIVKFINDLQGISDPEIFKDETLSTLEKIFKAKDSVILDWTAFNHGVRKPNQEDIFFHKSNKQARSQYPRHYQQDPLYAWIESGRCHGDLNVTRLSDLINFRDLKKTDFYKEILAPLNCRYVLTMAAHQGDDISVSISMVRPPDSINFSKEEVQLATLITPIISNTYSHLLLKKYNNLKDDLLELVSDKFHSRPFVIFSQDLDSVYRSNQMTKLGQQLSKFGDSIQEIFEKSDSIKNYLKVFSTGNSAQHRRLPEQVKDSVTISSNKTVNIELEFFKTQSANLYLIATLTLGKKDKNQTSLESDFGLSTRESQISQLASKGLDSTEIGEKLAISAWTVKNHLKNVYKKTNTHNRVQLLKLISSR